MPNIFILARSIMKVIKAESKARFASLQQNADLKVFHHHIYEYKKGVRNLILTTERASAKEYIEKRLQNEGINYVIALKSTLFY